MTPEELDEARASEANRIYNTGHSAFPRAESTAIIAARLAREGWTPPEPVDPDLLAAREWAKNNIHWIDAAYIARGAHDDAASIRAYLAGCTRGREGVSGLVKAFEALLDSYVQTSPVDRAAIRVNARAALASAKRGG